MMDFAYNIDNLEYQKKLVNALNGKSHSKRFKDTINSLNIKEEKLLEADKLQYIFAYKTGVDDFPLSELEKRNITLINSHADSTIIAEYSIGLSIVLVNRIHEFDLNLRRGIWYDKNNMYWKSFFDMKIGLFGYGHIGKAIHHILNKNRIQTYTIDRGHKYENINLVSSIEELVTTCDIVILSVPKVKETDNLFNKEIFKLMPHKYIVNVGRSNVINQKDLYEFPADICQIYSSGRDAHRSRNL